MVRTPFIMIPTSSFDGCLSSRRWLRNHWSRFFPIRSRISGPNIFKNVVNVIKRWPLLYQLMIYYNVYAISWAYQLTQYCNGMLYPVEPNIYCQGSPLAFGTK